MSPATRRRVLMFCMNSIFGESLCHLLREADGVELIGPCKMNADSTPEFPASPPDVVIVVAEDSEAKEVLALANHLLARYPELPVVRIGLQDNMMQVVSSRSLPASLTALLDVIQTPDAKRNA